MVKVSEEYKRLYHYTTAGGLDGILNTQSLWATQYIYLNDEHEIQLFIKNKLPEFIEPVLLNAYTERIYRDENLRATLFKKGVTLDEIVQHDKNIVGKSMFSPLCNQIYICSFTGESRCKNIDEHGQLSQWRAYGDDGGYCIILNTEKLENLMQEEARTFIYNHIVLSEVIYSDDDNKYKLELGVSLEEVGAYIFELALNVGLKYKKITSPIPYHSFLHCISRYKHFGFKEEREIRLVSVPETTPGARNRKIPQILGDVRKHIDLFSGLDTKLPIERIIVGPHKDKVARAESLRKRLEGSGIEVSISDIPYVGRRS